MRHRRPSTAGYGPPVQSAIPGACALYSRESIFPGATLVRAPPPLAQGSHADCLPLRHEYHLPTANGGSPFLRYRVFYRSPRDTLDVPREHACSIVPAAFQGLATSCRLLRQHEYSTGVEDTCDECRREDPDRPTD